MALTAKVFETLVIFVERRGRVLAKDELMAALWPDTAVEEKAAVGSHTCLRRGRPRRRG